MEVVKNIALISINATMAVQLISFLIFAYLFNRIMIRPLRQTMTERQQYTDRLSDDIAEANTAYADISQQITVQEKDARNTASKMRDEIEAEGRQSAETVIEQTRKEIQALKETAWREADAKITEARRQIESESESLSDQMANYLLERRSAV
jgi:F-type H+-transporting ATPase subunit b